MNIKKNEKHNTPKVKKSSGTSSLELFKIVAEELNLPTTVVKNTINKWWTVLAEHLREHGDFTFVGKAKFSLKKQRELVRSPSSAEMVKPKYPVILKIKPGSQLMRIVNGEEAGDDEVVEEKKTKTSKVAKKTPKK